MHSTRALLLSIGLGGCCLGGLTPPVPAVPTPPPVPMAPMAPGPAVPAPSGPIVITPGGLGGTGVTTDGRAVWPPTGPGCAELVACCTAASATDSTMGLACQLSVATPPADCTAARASIRQMIGEMGRPVPPACL